MFTIVWKNNTKHLVPIRHTPQPKPEQTKDGWFEAASINVSQTVCRPCSKPTNILPSIYRNHNRNEINKSFEYEGKKKNKKEFA